LTATLLSSVSLLLSFSSRFSCSLSSDDDHRIIASFFDVISDRHKIFDICKSGRWIVVKLLRSGGDRVNIDAGRIYMHGVPLNRSVILSENPNRLTPLEGKEEDEDEEEED
jgi:hypothetical protein